MYDDLESYLNEKKGGKMKFDYKSEPIMTLNNKYKRGKIVLSPGYQRNKVWSLRFKEQLVLSILMGFPIGNIILSANENESLNVVDGQQRLSTIFQFISGSKGINEEANFCEIKSQSSVLEIKKFVQKFKDSYGNTLSASDLVKCQKITTRKKITFEDFPETMKDEIYSYNLNMTYLQEFSKEDEAKFFKLLQNQEKLKAGEVINSIYYYNDDLNELTDQIHSKRDFCEMVNYKKNRSDFDKLFINHVGMLENKINLNLDNQKIIDYSEKFVKINNDVVDRLIRRINELTTIESDELFESASPNKRLHLIFFAFEYMTDTLTVSEIITKIKLIEKNEEKMNLLNDLVTGSKSKSEIELNLMEIFGDDFYA